MPIVKTIAVINQKGGVGKTTTVANLGQAIAHRGHKVCLIDLDPQSQLTLHLGAEASAESSSVYDLLTSGADLTSCAAEVSEHLALIPSVIDLAAAEMELIGTVGREQILGDRLSEQALPYEFVLIDCPPSISLVSENILTASDAILVPVIPTTLSLRTLDQLTAFVTDDYGALQIYSFFSKVDRRKRLHRDIVASLSETHAGVLKTAIPNSVQVERMGLHREPVAAYARRSESARAYEALWDELTRALESAKALPHAGE